MAEHLKIRPYARLITMLGDQLIKDETIALSELIKNSYDADSSWVKVTFANFGEDYAVNENSKITIEDAGCGMDEAILRNHWLNPATPEKLLRKKKGHTPGGRILQGEKGIGRFAVFKLGKCVSIVSRRRLTEVVQCVGSSDVVRYLDCGENEEHELLYDFSKYDSDFLQENGEEKELFLEDLSIEYTSRKPQVITSGNPICLGEKKKFQRDWGTRIEISDLKGVWSFRKIEKVWNDVCRMLPLFQTDSAPDFSIVFFKDGMQLFADDSNQAGLSDLLKSKSVMQVTNGHFDQEHFNYEFELDGKARCLSLVDERLGASEVCGLSLARDFLKDGRVIQDLRCGDFGFEFYVFDFIPDEAGKLHYRLDSTDKSLVRGHRTYLYRDGIRVMPYGDPNDDWLNVDIIRGTKKASSFFSNDQLVGCVYISQKDNPGLKDKTNREGLIEEGGEAQDFILLIQLFLQWLRAYPYGNYLAEKERRKEEALLKAGNTDVLIGKLKNDHSATREMRTQLETVEKSFQKERQLLRDRAEKVEDLAAIGLSIDMLMHDAMLSLLSAQRNLDSIVSRLASIGSDGGDDVLLSLQTIQKSLNLSIAGLKNVQQILPSTKQRPAKRNVFEAVNLVFEAYEESLLRNQIECRTIRSGPSLQAVITEAVLLQVFINLFDNALYWIKALNRPGSIRVDIDGVNEIVVFSDDGPGISELSKPYIFDAYYSGKGVEGRGLGLYIAKTLLQRYGYSIRLAEAGEFDALPGAVFVLDFAKK